MKVNRVFVYLSAILMVGCATVTKEDIERAKARDVPVIISNVYPSSPNSAGGVDAHVKFINTSNQTLKYVVFSVMPYNEVGDVAPSRIGNKTPARLRDVGPINPGEGNGTGYWENVWYNHSIRCIEVTYVDVTYMSGKSERIGPDLSKVMASGVSNSCTM